MPDIDAIDDAIGDAAEEGISSTRFGSRSVDRRSITELIKAAEYLANKEASAASVAAPGIRISRIRPTYE